MTDREQLLLLASEVRELRTKQKAFFRTTDRNLIPACREIEARVDKRVAEILAAKPAATASLFGDDAAARFNSMEKGGGL